MKIGFNLKSVFAAMLLLSPFVLSAQTLEDAQKAYNDALAANNAGNLEEAIAKFNVCLKDCDYLVEEEEDETAEELQTTVQGALPKLYIQLATDQLQKNDMTNGLANMYKAKEVAQKFGDKETADRADKIIPQIHYKLAAGEYKAGKMDDAIAECNKALKVDPDNGSIYYLKSAILLKKGNSDTFKIAALAGIEACKRSSDLKNKQKIEDLGYKHFLKKAIDAKGSSNYDDAESFTNTSLQFVPDDPTALYLLTALYNSQGKDDEAIATGEKAVAAEQGGDEAKAKIYMIIAESYAKKGDTAAACEAYKKAEVGQYAESAKYQRVTVLKCE